MYILSGIGSDLPSVLLWKSSMAWGAPVGWGEPWPGALQRARRTGEAPWIAAERRVKQWFTLWWTNIAMENGGLMGFNGI